MESWSRVELGRSSFHSRNGSECTTRSDKLLPRLAAVASVFEVKSFPKTVPLILRESKQIQELKHECFHSPKEEETRQSSALVHVTNQTSLGPEFCEPPDLDQDLHYVVRYINPNNFKLSDSTPHTIFPTLTSSLLGCTKSMPEGATTLTAHLHHHLSFATALRSSYAYHES
ncbi:hypothetical protein VNO80_24267 [Phaseolus coccineus]|uniref:Uncharacterized protein n=1 Tax=Phaseolus coccineus TaxID=3886 RepID=A0AAN9LSL3_PHACN